MSWLPRLGAVGALITTACCIGIPAVVSLASAVGAGFLIQDRYLQPLLIIMLAITVAASALTYSRHRNPFPVAITVVAALGIYWFIYRDYILPLVWIGAVGLVAAQVWDVIAIRTCTLPKERQIAR